MTNDDDYTHCITIGYMILYEMKLMKMKMILVRMMYHDKDSDGFFMITGPDKGLA